MNNMRIFHPSSKEWMKRGFKDFFAIYVGFGLCTVATANFFYEWRNGITIPRYKKEYTIFRPTDEETKMYPRHYITDNHLLSDDHPTKLEDCDPLSKSEPLFQGRIMRHLSHICK